MPRTTAFFFMGAVTNVSAPIFYPPEARRRCDSNDVFNFSEKLPNQAAFAGGGGDIS
jgi:hypothetical protein